MPTQQSVTVPATKDFRYQGRAYRRGDLVTMSPLDAAVHARQGHVSLSRGHRPPPPKPEPVPAPEPPPRRRRARKTAAESDNTYLRRDMVAEPTE